MLAPNGLRWHPDTSQVHTCKYDERVHSESLAVERWERERERGYMHPTHI